MLYVLYFYRQCYFLQVYYRESDVKDHINMILKTSDSLSKIVHSFTRLVWGDRNLRYWRVMQQNQEHRPENLSDLDQITRKSRGRQRILNNKDPEGVELFKSKSFVK